MDADHTVKHVPDEVPEDTVVKADPDPDTVKHTNTAVESAVTPDAGWGIDKGTVRENNEDSLAAVTVNQASESESQSVGLYAVADGMGGHQAGEVASKLAVRTAIRQLVEAVTESDEPMPENYRVWLEQAVAVANRVVRKTGDDQQKNLGTTLVIAVVVGNDVHIANVGDSRAYLVTPTKLRQITHDHTFVQMLVDSGTITPEQAAKHPRRNVLTQAIGAQDQADIDLYDETLGADELILLCSDGLWETLGDEQILEIIRTAETPGAACQALVDACNEKGSQDNIAAVLVRPGAET
ncbi:MAG: Stp1/IreP family PP2C-type Ser/Thr phosphatase [Anaerolineae bacterium]|nr:Stp1/IreP family PP2C-type Ser/Thr phosphatase [Anaerolineae bacterium]